VRETKRSREIVKGLLDFARQSVPKKTPADINRIIDRSVSVIENQLSIRHIQLEKNFSGKLPDVVVDENQIQQVLINLIENSVYAIGDSSGKISISTELIKLAPYGITHIKKALCPKGHDLMDTTIKIEGAPSIKVKAKHNGNEGYIHLNPVYGKNEHHYGIPMGKKGKLEFLCYKCGISLMKNHKSCPKCESPVYMLEVPGKGMLEGCVNKSCGWQYWETVEKEGSKEYVEFKVSDTGSGISKENVEKIFDPFFTTKGQKGNGLGLAVVWGIIDNHDGTITVESEVGKGTTFTIRLPSVKAI
jgi:signal transduction histidine kinase